MDRLSETADTAPETAVEAGGCAPPVYVTPAPVPVLRPGLAGFLFERNLDYAQAAEMIGDVSRMGVSNWCRPFGDPERSVPRRAAMERIAAFTGWTLERTRAAFTPPQMADAP